MFFSLYRHTDDDFPKISDHLPKILQNFSEGHANVAAKFSENYQKIAEDCRRLSRKIRGFLDYRPTDLSTINIKDLISVKSSISSLVRIWAEIPENTPPEYQAVSYESYECYIFQ